MDRPAGDHGAPARSRDRLPWDIEQDFASIAPYTIEEAYEVADAIDRNDIDDLKDELGDLLLQVVFHAQMAKEQGAFDFGDVVAAICDKMTRRHPHVFRRAARRSEGRRRAPDSREWEAQKRARTPARGDDDSSALAGISRGMPEWQRAVKLQSRAARVGFDWPGTEPVIAKLHEEIEEVRVEFARRRRAGANRERLQDEIGDVLFVCANLARHARVDVGAALRHANLKFERRFRSDGIAGGRRGRQPRPVATGTAGRLLGSGQADRARAGMKTLLLFLLTAIAEIVGCYLPYVWLRKGGSAWLLLPAAASLALFAWLLTLHPTASGRVYAAYGGVYVTMAIGWLWWVDAVKPTRWDLIGAALCLLGMGVIMFAPRTA